MRRKKTIAGIAAGCILLLVFLLVFFWETEDQYLMKIFIDQHGAMDWHWFRSRLILLSGRYIHQKNKDGQTLLMQAAYGYGPMRVLEILIRKGADVNAADNEGLSPLMWAIEGMKRERVAFLLKHGADVNAQNKMGNTPLIAAVEGRNTEIVRLLVESGADVNRGNNESEVPLLKSLELGDWAPPTEKEGQIACLLIEYGADVNARNSLGLTPLMMAVRHGLVNVTRLLIERGADVNARDARGDSVLKHYSFTKPALYQFLKESGAKL